MKILYLYPVPILFSYLLFDGMNMVSIWTFIIPVIVTTALIWAQQPYTCPTIQDIEKELQ